MAAAIVGLSFILLVCTGAIVVAIIRSTETMSTAIDRLSSTVSALDNVVESAIAVVDGLSTHLRALAAQPGGPTEANLNALADDLDAHRVALAEAVAEGTQAEDDIDSATTQPPAPAPGPETVTDTSAGGAQDTLAGGQGNDTIFGGNDTGTGAATLEGGAGNDSTTGTTATDTLAGGQGADSTSATGGPDTQGG